MRRMFSNAFRNFGDDPEKYRKIKELEPFFEKVFQDLANKPLTETIPMQTYVNPSNQMVGNSQINNKIRKIEGDLNKLKQIGGQKPPNRTQNTISSILGQVQTLPLSDK